MYYYFVELYLNASQNSLYYKIFIKMFSLLDDLHIDNDWDVVEPLKVCLSISDFWLLSLLSIIFNNWYI